MAKAAKIKRLSKVAKEFNVGISTIIDFLGDKGIEIETSPNAKIDAPTFDVLLEEFQGEKTAKEESRKAGLKKVIRETVTLEEAEKIAPKLPEQEIVIIKNMENTTPEVETPKVEVPKEEEKEIKSVKPHIEANDHLDETPEGEPKILGKIDLSAINQKTRPSKKAKAEAQKTKGEPKIKPKAKEIPKREEKKTDKPTAPEHIKTDVEKLGGPTVVGKIELPKPIVKKKKPVASSTDSATDSKKKRKRINNAPVSKAKFGAKPPYKKVGRGKKAEPRKELTDEQIQAQIKETLARLNGGGKTRGVKHRKAKREAITQQQEDEMIEQELASRLLKVTEFVTANELASMMNIGVTEIISACMSLGLFVSINQRLDAETISIVSEEFGYKVEFVSAEVQEAIIEEEDKEEDLVERPPIITIMGHVDHGKTSLLDHIRQENVIGGEAGGITQHIGAYNVQLDNGKKITFLDTPGHEAFTAMRARGAQVTDIVIIVIAADDKVMPQTKEAINHAQAAGVPMIFAINKIDRPNANPEKIKEELSAMNILVEDWGGKYQSQEISAKKGTNVYELLEKVLLEAELLELKANPNKNGVGTVVESSLDKGRGYVTTVLVESGTLKVGDILLAGCFAGKVKALQNERGTNIKQAGPSIPVSILGLSGAPNAGDKFNIMNDEKEAKAIATKRLTLQREQGTRTKKQITLDEIGRRLALGDFKELNLIVKGDVDGSIEALSDSLLKLSAEKVQINVIHKSVGQISESDILLASASDAIIIGFQVRPSASARKLAEKEEVDIRLYSVIYKAMEEIKAAMEGMLDAKIVEKIVCNIEIRETFKISKVGTIAGCFVLDGTITRNTKIRLIRDGIVVYAGNLGSLKRFKDDMKEVKAGYECGLNIDKFNDIKVGDIIEGYDEVEVKQTLS